MKITGPTAEPPDTAPAAGQAESAAAPVDGQTRVGDTAAAGTRDGERVDGSGAAFAQALAGVAPRDVAPSGNPAPATTRPIATPNDTSKIAAELEAGRLQPQQAVERVLQQVLSRQVGDDAPPAVREKIRAALQDALETDPLLADKLRRLNR
jgi:hypothetical protein